MTTNKEMTLEFVVRNKYNDNETIEAIQKAFSLCLKEKLRNFANKPLTVELKEEMNKVIKSVGKDFESLLQKDIKGKIINE